jgi:molybdate transport system substrate-binding protein
MRIVTEMAKTTGFVLVVALLLPMSGCDNSSSAITAPGSDLQGDLLVSAAASLTDAFTAVASAFEAANPGVDVAVNFGGSSALREQIIEGAPVDVFASANMANMDKVVEAGEVAREPQVFATNLLQIAVPSGNPAGIAGLEDFSRQELLIGLCAEAVPCGDFAQQALALAGVVPAVDTYEPDVRALLTKIEAGELDAGITYVTDVATAGARVAGVDIPIDQNVVAEYPIAALVNAPHGDIAEAFVAFVLSDVGEAILADYGFASP